MITALGIAVIVLGLIVWIGQALSFFVPDVATRLAVNSPADEMDESLYIIETRANGLSDILLTWTFPLAGLLLILEHPAWPFLALIGGAIYIYFALLTIFTRVFLKQHGRKIGSAGDVRTAYVFSVLWLTTAAIMIVLAIQALTP